MEWLIGVGVLVASVIAKFKVYIRCRVLCWSAKCLYTVSRSLEVPFDDLTDQLQILNTNTK